MVMRTRLSRPCTASSCEAMYSSTDLKLVLAIVWGSTLRFHHFCKASPELACTVPHQYQASGMRFSDRRTRRIAIGAAIVACILIVFVSVWTQSEPIYKGKRLGNWIQD